MRNIALKISEIVLLSDNRSVPFCWFETLGERNAHEGFLIRRLVFFFFYEIFLIHFSNCLKLEFENKNWNRTDKKKLNFHLF